MQTIRIALISILASACQAPKRSTEDPTWAFDFTGRSLTGLQRVEEPMRGGGAEGALSYRSDAGVRYGLFFRGHSYGVSTGQRYDMAVDGIGVRLARDFGRVRVGAGLGRATVSLVPNDPAPHRTEEEQRIDGPTLGQFDISLELRLLSHHTGLVKSMSYQTGAILNNGDTHVGQQVSVPRLECYMGLSLVLVPGEGLVDYGALRHDDGRAMAMALLLADIPSGIVYFLASPFFAKGDL